MRGLRLVLVVLLTLLLQLALADRLAIGGVRPALTVWILVVLSLRKGPVAGTLIGFGLGLFEDLLAQSTLGMYTLAKTLTGYAVGKLSDHLADIGLPFPAILTGVAVLGHDLVFLVPFTGGDLVQVLVLFGTRSIPTALYTTGVALAILVASRILAGRAWGAVEDGA